MTPAFRYEQPQAGRYRQHHQLGVEALGTDDPDLDVEVIALLDDFYRAVGLAAVELRVNSIGDDDCRPGVPRGPRARTSRRTRPSCATSTERPGERTRCASSTASSRVPAASAARTRRAVGPRSASPARRTSPACSRASTRSGSPTTVDDFLVRGLDYYTRTTFEFASHRPRRRAERDRRRRSLRRARRGARRPADARIGFGERDRADPARLRRRGRRCPTSTAARRLRRRPHRRRRGARPDARAAPARDSRRPRLRRALDEGPAAPADRSGARRRAHRRRRTSSPTGTVTVRELRGGRRTCNETRRARRARRAESGSVLDESSDR